MYVVGVMTDLEYSLRAVAAATEKATFGVTSAQRAARMKQRLHEIQKLVNDPLLQPALDAVASRGIAAGQQGGNRGGGRRGRQGGVTSSPNRPTATGSRRSIRSLPQPSQYKN